MSGELWALVTGIGFGIFQSVNRRAVYNMDVYLSTFLQLLVSTVVLGLATILTVDLIIIQTAPASAWIYFSLAGFFHFFVGWTMLNTSQKKIGAARTSPLIGTTPLFGAFVGFVFFDEILDLFSWGGILLIIFGVYLITRPTGNQASSDIEEQGWRTYIFALGAATAWSISPIFIRLGFAEVPNPIFGVTVGMLASSLGYMIPLYMRRQMISLKGTPKEAIVIKLVAGILVGFSTWTRWIALDLTNVATVLAITMVATPIVLIISPLIMGKKLEKITSRLVTGASLVVIGALILVLIP